MIACSVKAERAVFLRKSLREIAKPRFNNLSEGDIGVCGIAVLDIFSYVISVILISKCGISFFFFSILDGINPRCIISSSFY